MEETLSNDERNDLGTGTDDGDREGYQKTKQGMRTDLGRPTLRGWAMSTQLHLSKGFEVHVCGRIRLHYSNSSGVA